mmetsp:Transcript_90081/g.193124  ORF Transcript_90081/g.193124 Transcript_90081/m.193124 type:complete len:226 (+) Transcript_90081:935-1612(+)
MKRGMTGFVKIRSKSNWTALAAACRAFTGSLCVQETHCHKPSGMGPMPAVTPDVAAPGAALASALPLKSSLFFRSFSSSVSFFFRWRMLRWGSSLSAAFATLVAAVRVGGVLGSSLVVASSPTGAATVEVPSLSLCLQPSTTSRTKATRRSTGRTRKLTTVGIGPMTIVVTMASEPRMIPMRHKYIRNCFTNRKRKASQSTLSSVLKKPFSNVTRFQNRSMTRLV